MEGHVRKKPAPMKPAAHADRSAAASVSSFRGTWQSSRLPRRTVASAPFGPTDNLLPMLPRRLSRPNRIEGGLRILPARANPVISTTALDNEACLSLIYGSKYSEDIRFRTLIATTPYPPRCKASKLIALAAETNGEASATVPMAAMRKNLCGFVLRISSVRRDRPLGSSCLTSAIPEKATCAKESKRSCAVLNSQLINSHLFGPVAQLVRACA